MIVLAEASSGPDDYRGRDLHGWFGSVEVRRRDGIWTTNEDGLIVAHPDADTALWWAEQMNQRKNPGDS